MKIEQLENSLARLAGISAILAIGSILLDLGLTAISKIQHEGVTWNNVAPLIMALIALPSYTIIVSVTLNALGCWKIKKEESK